jgi:DnaJ-class molecular chaperone
MTPIGWTPEGTATWQSANEALRRYFEARQDPPCPWCHGQGGFLRTSEELRTYVPVLCDGCFGTGVWKSGDDAKR